MSGVSEYGIAVFHNKGDVLSATPIARQLKADEPDCRVTWFTAAEHEDVLAHNPYVDSVVVVPGDPLALDAEIPNLIRWRAWTRFFAPAAYLNREAKVGGSLFDLVRSAARLRWTVPFEFTLRLSPAEVRAAQRYLARLPRGPKILIETDYFSGQSIWTDEWTMDLVEILKPIDAVLLFTGKTWPRFFDEVMDRHPKAVWCREPWRQNAEIYNHCDAFVGVASGISTLTYSDWCRRDVPHVEIVKNEHYGGAELQHHEELVTCFSRTAFRSALAELVERLGGAPCRGGSDAEHGQEPASCPVCGAPPAPAANDEAGTVQSCPECTVVLVATPSAQPDSAVARSVPSVQVLAEATSMAPGVDHYVVTERSEARAALSAQAEQSLDVLVLPHVLQKSADPGELLQLAARALRPKGVLVCTVPNESGLCSQALGERWPWRSRADRVRFTPGPLRRLLAQCGFQVLLWRTGTDAVPRELPLTALARLAPQIPPDRRAELLLAAESAGRGEEIVVFARPRARARTGRPRPLQQKDAGVR